MGKGNKKSSKKKPVETRDLSNWKIMRKFRQRLAKVLAQRDEVSGPSPRAVDPKRKLLEEDYFSLMLFGLLNPVLDSMRGLCAASDLEKMQKEVCTHRVSLGSFSEAQSVFDPEVLKEIFLQLASESSHSWGDPRLASVADQLTLIDGSLIPALPRMHWALWLNDKNRAAKLHLKFKVLKQSACEALLTTGKTCERKTLRQFVKRGEIIVADRAAGVTWQGRVKLGKDWQGEPIRVVKVEVDDKELLIVTDLEMEAELISLIYRYRWQVELFFKWLKCILKCRHLLAESERGVAIQIYTALIAALLLQGLTGKRPSKRQIEMIQLHLTGYLSLDELMAALKLEKTKD
ncbi:MAG: hypothetical protein ACI9NQ_000817 [Paracoccaceae bacterium]